MHTQIRAFAERSADAKAGSAISFVASTSDLARDGMTIDSKGWKLDNYRSSPVVLWSHDYTGNRPPIGRAENVRVDGDKLKADIVFDQGDPFAVDVERKFREGFLNAVSVGWDTLEFQPTEADQPWNGGKVLSAELLDISAVNVPGDPKALIERQKRALAAQANEVLKLVGDEPEATTNPESKPGQSAKATWPETAAAMARVFTPFVLRTDTQRSGDYQRLVGEYARHGKTPPEFLTQQELDALSASDIRAHFLEGEPDLCADVFSAMASRAGAVLSQRNLDDLQKAGDLITGVIARAKKDAEQTDAEHAAEAEIVRLHRLFNGDLDK